MAYSAETSKSPSFAVPDVNGGREVDSAESLLGWQPPFSHAYFGFGHQSPAHAVVM